MCLFLSPNHIQTPARDLSLKFNFVMSVPNLLCPMGLQFTCVMYMPVSCGDCNEVAFHGDESQQLQREVALLYPFSFSKARLPSAATKLLKMKMELWRFRLIPLDCEGWLTAFLSDGKIHGAAEAS